MPTTLGFPSRFSLLSQAWKFEYASSAIVAALGIKADRLTKMVAGDTKNLNSKANPTDLNRRLAAHLDRIGVLAAKGVDQSTFISKFGSPDDLDFVQFIASTRPVPIPPSVLALPRRNAEKLLHRLGGLCLFYRLGVEQREEIRSGGRFIKDLPILRRIPAVIEDTGQGFLRYKDSYAWYGTDLEVASATGFIFLIQDHFTIFAEDSESAGISELFLVELRQNAVARAPGDTSGAMYEGVLVMKGDTAVPTACKVLLRRGSDEMQARLAKCQTEDDWQSLARSLERRIYLEDNDQDGIFEFASMQNPNSAVETTDLEPFSGLAYSWYANKLQIRQFKLDIR
jgi:hypothetical protein